MVLTASICKTLDESTGIDPQHTMTEQDKKKMPWLFLSGIVASLFVVYAMMVIVHSLRVTHFSSGLATGTIIWAGFALTHSLNTLWEGRKPLVWSSTTDCSS